MQDEQLNVYGDVDFVKKDRGDMMAFRISLRKSKKDPTAETVGSCMGSA